MLQHKIQIDNTDMFRGLDKGPHHRCCHLGQVVHSPFNKCMVSVELFVPLIVWVSLKCKIFGSVVKDGRAHILIGERPVSSGSLESSVSV